MLMTSLPVMHLYTQQAGHVTSACYVTGTIGMHTEQHPQLSQSHMK